VLLYTFSDRPESAAVARDVIAHLAPRRVLADVVIDGDDWTTRDHSAIGQISDGTRTRVAAEYAFAGRPMPANSLAEIITSFDNTDPSTAGVATKAFRSAHRKPFLNQIAALYDEGAV